MKVLVIGGTGAIGTPLIEQLSQIEGAEIYATSRKERKSSGNIKWIQGNVHNDSFLDGLLNIEYDAIFDFMVYGLEELKGKLPLLLKSTKQYFFFSSSRVYADSLSPLTEDSPRLLDFCKDQCYLHTEEYALAKAREENLLFSSKATNWTIIRPYITYNTERLQLGVYEKENWLFRALQGRTVIFPKDISEKNTSLTYGSDVVKAVIQLIGKKEALGEAFHVVTDEQITWQNVLDIYKDIVKEKTGIVMKIVQPENSNDLHKVWPYPSQISYDRLLNRSFNSNKIIKIAGKIDFLSVRDGLEYCLGQFLDHVKWRSLNIAFEAWSDKQFREKTPLSVIPGNKARLMYIKSRYFL